MTFVRQTVIPFVFCTFAGAPLIGYLVSLR